MIDLYVNRAELQSVKLNSNQIAVVIDVLRASTTIVTALANGCQAVIPVAEVEEARALKRKMPEQSVLLGGERNEVSIPGFDLSNSPFDYSSDIINGKRIVFTSTNGARLFSLARDARQTIVAGFVNMTGVCNYVLSTQLNIAILCAGKHGKFGLEDVVCGGMIIDIIQKSTDVHLELNDGAMASHILYQQFANNLQDMLFQSSHGKRLLEIGQEKDLVRSAAVDSMHLVPILRGDELIPLNQQGE